MNETRMTLILVALLVLAPACGTHDHSHGDHSHDDHDHAEAPAERPAIAVTHWTDRSELFMEYPAFVAGESGRAAIHVTDLADFSPLTAGEVTVSLRSRAGEIFEFRGGPSRPGIFGVDLAMETPGDYDFAVRIDAPGWRDVHDLGSAKVHAKGDRFDAETEDEADAGISFLKEQQWTLEFGTAPAERRALRASVTVPATIRPRAGGEAIVAAPVSGRIEAGPAVPGPGTRVRAGTILARIVPRSEDVLDAAGLRAALVDAEQRYGLAESERARVARLVDARALPARRLAEAEAALASASAERDAARQRWSRFEVLGGGGGTDTGDGSFAVRAPFDGVVTEARFSPGATVEANDVLVRIVDTARVHVSGAIPESSAIDPRSIVGGEIVCEDAPPIALGEPLAVGRVVDEATRTTDVRFALGGDDTALRIGQAVGLRLFVGSEVQETAVPETAIVDDGGRPVVFVQTGGEAFERRPVTLGTRSGGWVQVVAGIEPGERVVHRGAYLVRLAAMSTQIPSHGHVH